MKIRKNAEQKNITLDMGAYTLSEKLQMLFDKEVFYINGYEISFSDEDYEGQELRLSCSDLDEIKVEYNKDYDCYCNVAIGKNGKKYYVSL